MKLMLRPYTEFLATKSFLNSSVNLSVTDSYVIVDVTSLGAWAYAKGGSATASQYSKEYDLKVTDCCSTKCSSTTNECYTKCNSGYKPDNNTYIYRMC